MIIESLVNTLEAHDVSQEKIQFIVNRLQQVDPSDTGQALWHTFCASCLEMAIDPQAVFLLASVDNDVCYEDLREIRTPKRFRVRRIERFDAEI